MAKDVSDRLFTTVSGVPIERLYTPEDIQRDKPNQELKEAAAKGSAEDEGWRQRKDGSRFWASVVVTALRDEAGQLRGFAKVTRDMTERRRAEEGLRRYEELVKNGPIGLIVLHLEKMGDAGALLVDKAQAVEHHGCDRMACGHQTPWPGLAASLDP